MCLQKDQVHQAGRMSAIYDQVKDRQISITCQYCATLSHKFTHQVHELPCMTLHCHALMCTLG